MKIKKSLTITGILCAYLLQAIPFAQANAPTTHQVASIEIYGPFSWDTSYKDNLSICKKSIRTAEVYANMMLEENKKPRSYSLRAGNRGGQTFYDLGRAYKTLPLFDKGDYIYNCSKVTVNIFPKIIKSGSWLTSDTDYDHKMIFTIECKSRTFQEKLLLSLAKACEIDPTMPQCYTESNIAKINAIRPVEVVKRVHNKDCRYSRH